MKIALTFSGQARAVEQCYPIIYNNLISKFDDIDIFIHTWKDADFEKIHLYNPTYFKIDGSEYQFKKYDIKNYNNHGNWETTVRMFASFYEVGNLLKLSNKSYDVVIRERFEHIIEKPFDMDLIFDKINQGCLVIPNDYCNAGGYNDQLAFGSVDNMLKYFDTYNNIQDLLDMGTKAHPETILKASLDSNDIKVYQYQHNFFDTQHPPLYHKYFLL